MAKANKVFTRLSISDLILDTEEMKKFETAMKVLFDEDNQMITDLDFYVIGHEDEDGNECHENGEYIN